MAYTITKTNGVTIPPGTIPDGTINNTSTSLTLIGRNYSGYGQIMVDNLVHLLENFAYSNSPSNPLAGQLWWDTTHTTLKAYTGSSWKVVGGATASSVAPTSTAQGDLWFNTGDQQLSIWTGTEWLLIGPTYKAGNGKSGAFWEELEDAGAVPYSVLSIYLDGTRTAIISNDAFTPASAPGFGAIKVGYNMSSVTSLGTIWGTANNASYLGGQPAANYFRTNQNNTGTGTLTLNNDSGITIGVDSDLEVSVDGTDAQIKNNTNGGDVGIFAKVGGVSSRYIYINGASGNVEVAADPISDLGIATKQYVDNSISGSPYLGTAPTADTASAGTNTTQVATTAFVYEANVGLKGYVDGVKSTTNTDLSLKANIASPTLTGTPAAPTASPGTNTTQIATTAFVREANVALKAYADSTLAPIASPTLTGDPKAPTAAAGDNSTSIATTAFVYSANVSMKGYIDAADALKANLAGPTFTGEPKAPTPTAGDNTTKLATTGFVYAANVSMKGYVDAADALKADANNATLTGTPVAPTAPGGTNTTQIATTAYVQNEITSINSTISGLTLNKILQLNSKFEILDAGTGSANLVIDNTSVLTASASGVSLKDGATAATQSQTYSGTGDNKVATTQYVKTASTWWGGSAKFVSTLAPGSGDGNNGDFWFQISS